jgi:uncharacterized beta-barrel protein YwiB (DUF1934 family)
LRNIESCEEETMDRDVLIRVRGLQISEENDDQEPIELVVPGHYFSKNGVHYIRYEEIMEDFTEPTINYIKYGSKSLEVRKQGPVNVNMKFELGKRTISFYATPYGTFPMGLAASNLTFEEKADFLRIFVSYAMDVNEEHVADCYLTIEAQPKDAPGFEL